MYYVTNYIFAVKMGLGTPQMNGTFVVLSDNSNIFIDGVNCTTCSPAFYDPEQSTSYVAPSPPINNAIKQFGFTANTVQG
jgi:hypothetical protein